MNGKKCLPRSDYVTSYIVSTRHYYIATIFALQGEEFVLRYTKWIRLVVFENMVKILSCRTAVLGCHIYRCSNCGHVELVYHSCKSRFCPTCGKHATDVWCNQGLNNLLDVPCHHLVLTIPWRLRMLILVNREYGLNLLVRSASKAVQQWAKDVKQMRKGIILDGEME